MVALYIGQRGRGVFLSVETRLDGYVVDDDDADHDEEDGDDDDDADANDAQEMMLEIKPTAEHMLPQTFGEDSEMLAPDLYYHRVLINTILKF